MNLACFSGLAEPPGPPLQAGCPSAVGAYGPALPTTRTGRPGRPAWLSGQALAGLARVLAARGLLLASRPHPAEDLRRRDPLAAGIPPASTADRSASLNLRPVLRGPPHRRGPAARGGTPFVVCATAAESERSGAGAPPVLRRWRHHLPGKSAGGRDHDQRPVTGTDREGSRVILLENAQDVGDLFAVTRAGPAPADHDPLADIGGCEADLEPVAHAGHLFPGRAARRRVPGPGPGAWIVAGLGAAAGSGGRLRVGDGGMMPF
jgi:hypothetical protein